MLKRLASSPSDELTTQYNELVRAVEQLLKIRGNGGISVNIVDGVPCLTLRGQLSAGQGFATADIASGDNTPTGNIEVYEGDLNSPTDTGVAITCRNSGPDITNGDEVRWGYTDGQLECFKICTTPGGGGLTSVGLIVPSGLGVSGSPLTANGNITITTALSGLAIGTGSGFSTATIGGNMQYGSSTINLANDVSIASTLTVPNGGALKIKDVGGSHPLSLSTSATYSHDTTLSINTVPLVGGGGTTYDFTLTIKDNISLNQDLLKTSNVAFGTANIAGLCVMGAFSLGGAAQVINITANTNDLSLTSDATIVLLLPDNNWALSGISGASSNEVWYELYNGSTHTLTLTHEDASSSTFHRFHFASGTDYVLPSKASVLIYYPDSRWRLVIDSAVSAVTSVALTVPSGLSVSGSPVTSTGTLAVTTSLDGVLLGDGSGFSAVSSPSDSTKFLNGATTPTFANVHDSDLVLTNITTNNVSTSKHGFVPILPNDASKFLDGTGVFSTPSGSGATFANPSASVGLSVVNGSASTAMRSDAAPPISQSITPHWTGAHQFDSFKLTDVGGSHNATVAIGSTYTSNRTLTLTTGDASRTVTIQGNPTLDDWFDQSVKSSTTPTFTTIVGSSLTASAPVFTSAGKALTSTGVVTTTNGGTGVSSANTDGSLLFGNSSTGLWTVGTITAGANVTITNFAGGVTIASTGGGGGGGGSVTSVSVVTAHGFSGSVANSTTTPAITLNCTVNAPVLAANGTSISGATTTGSGSTVVLNSGPSIASSLTLTGASPTLLLNDNAGTHTLGLSVSGTLSANHSLNFDFNNDVTLGLAGDFDTAGSLSLPAVSQGDVWYGSASGNISALAKSSTATRYLSNQGTSNNPSWSQVNLSNGVTSTLAVANGGTGQTSYTDGQLLIGNTVGNTLALGTLTAGTGIGITLGHGTITLTATGGTGGGGVSSVDITQPAAGITFTGGPITSSGAITCALANDLAAVENLSSTGIAVRTAADTWTVRTITGTLARIDVNDGGGISINPTVDISASYVGQTSISTLGSITVGTWLATTISTTHGGTGQTTYTDGQLLIGNSFTSGLNKATITAGSNITVTNGNGSITIAGQAGTVTSIATSNGITGGTITGSGTISGINAAADSSTKGVATFSSSLFSDNGSGLISTKFQMSITSDGSGLKLSGDQSTPSDPSCYSYLSSTKGWATVISLLKALPSYNGSATQVVYNNSGTVAWQTCT